MKKVLIGVHIALLLVIVSSCHKKELTFTCDVDTSQTGFQLAGAYDDCLVWNAQKIMAHIESEDIDIRSTNLDLLPFGSSYADLNGEENWIQPMYTIVPEDMTAYPNTPIPDTINGVVLAKCKSKDKIDEDFGLSNDVPQGICADVQQVVYDTVLHTILSQEERNNYLSEGKQLQFIPDDDWPPLDETTNPVNRGSSWLDVDPAAMVTRDGDNYYYEPRALYVEFDDPDFQDIDEKYRGVRYCKFLSHQLILSWMLEKSFEEDPVLIAPSIPECNRPSSLDSQAGSCLFYFSQAETYYCSDYTGSGFTFENAEAKCNSRPANPYLNPIYSTAPCSEREDEIESSIPGYQGLTGICVIHCQTAEEFIWNIYTENPEESCAGFEFFAPGEILPESYPPLQEALDALVSDSTVTVRTVEVEAWGGDANYYYSFEPSSADPTVGFIFYPGGLVDPRSYAPPIRAHCGPGIFNGNC